MTDKLVYYVNTQSKKEIAKMALGELIDESDVIKLDIFVHTNNKTGF